MDHYILTFTAIRNYRLETKAMRYAHDYALRFYERHAMFTTLIKNFYRSAFFRGIAKVQLSKRINGTDFMLRS